MGLASILRKGVAIADRVTGGTGGLQAEITHQVRKATANDYGAPDYEAAVTRSALVERRQRLIRTRMGEDIESMAKVTFTTPCGVKEGDLIALPGGDVWHVIQVAGPVDPETSEPFIEEVYLAATPGR